MTSTPADGLLLRLIVAELEVQVAVHFVASPAEVRDSLQDFNRNPMQNLN